MNLATRYLPVSHLDRVLDQTVVNPRVLVGGSAATPWTTLDAIDRAYPAYTLHVLLALPGLPDRDGVTWETTFVGPGTRGSIRQRYIPSRFSRTPQLFAAALPPDIVLVNVSPPDRGTVSLGSYVAYLPEAIEACRARGGVVIAQVNRCMPYTYGDGEYPLDAFDALVEVEEPLGARGSVPGRRTAGVVLPDELRVIGEHISSRVGDSSTLQMGIGAIPDAALAGLEHRRNLRIWSELLTDGTLELFEAGTLDPGSTIVGTFASGSADLYAWLDHNERVRLLRVSTTNNPANIARQPRMVSINSALQVDLYDQANASRIGGRIYSGFGGQPDFTVGAQHSPDGQAIMALMSWVPKHDVSTIVPQLTEPVTSLQHSVVVTEQGVAEMSGFDEREQASNLIEYAAHPRARDELRAAAARMGLA